MEIKEDFIIDLSGLRCPDPLSAMRNKLMDMESGQTLKVIATDKSTTWDFSNYCKYLGHEMMDQVEKDNKYYYWIRKG